MAQPLRLRTVVIPKEQGTDGADIIRFTADYLASDVAALVGSNTSWYPTKPARSQSGVVYIPMSDCRDLKQTRGKSI